MSKIYILNTTIITTPGLTYTSRVIGICEAKSLLGVDATDSDRTSDRAAGLHIVTHIPVGPRPAVISAVGHAATATIASEVLGRPVAVDRTPANMQDGDLAVCIKLRGRPPEGAILNREEMEAIGWDIVLVEARDPMHLQRHLTKLERALALISAPDDPAKDGEQTPGTRRRGRAPLQEHFIVRLPAPLGGTYHEVMQYYGTEAWEIVDGLTAESAARHASGEPAMEAIGWDIVLVEARDPMHLQRHLTKLERALALISAPDDPAKDGEQTPGTRRRGRAQRRLGLLEAAHRHALARQLGALQEHFIVRLPAPLGGTYHEVMQHYGTEAWEIVDGLTAESAARHASGVPATVVEQTATSAARHASGVPVEQTTAATAAALRSPRSETAPALPRSLDPADEPIGLIIAVILLIFGQGAFLPEDDNGPDVDSPEAREAQAADESKLERPRQADKIDAVFSAAGIS